MSLFRSLAKRTLHMTLAFCAWGCDRSVAQAATSLAADPGADPGKPPKALRMVWLHHSTGDRLLDGGLRAALQGAGYVFHDINYGEATVEGYCIGDHTDPPDFPGHFNNPRRFSTIAGWELPPGQKHDVVMFKSCYPASDIDSEAKLEAYKGYYNSMLATFKAHPGTLFVAMSTPPLVRAATSAQAAARARRWAKWITTEYAKGVPNVKVFDLFDALAVREGHPQANTLVPEFATSRDDSHPSPAGARAVTRLFLPWLNRAVREAGLVK
jgi:hypothetical protein